MPEILHSTPSSQLDAQVLHSTPLDASSCTRCHSTPGWQSLYGFDAPTGTCNCLPKWCCHCCCFFGKSKKKRNTKTKNEKKNIRIMRRDSGTPPFTFEGIEEGIEAYGLTTPYSGVGSEGSSWGGVAISTHFPWSTLETPASKWMEWICKCKEAGCCTIIGVGDADTKNDLAQNGDARPIFGDDLNKEHIITVSEVKS
ncbi:hypothetical protein KSP40_PGU016840 [Platanthera guangdongensis]|uniref:Uncharacterized protein n=1 Tax=Platanthera guangdongensis TaxID=2320717 RepID=A0ABR2LEF3_9ASPA